jgi:Transglutaminase-like superfamily
LHSSDSLVSTLETPVVGLRVALWPVGVGVVVSLASFVTLVAMPYSTSWIERTSSQSALEAPGPGVAVGRLTWDYALYQRSPALDPFRKAFAGCADKTGVEAARCVTTILNTDSPVGRPLVEFVDARFDPATALATHLEHGAGHCTARSALGATALLSLGVPARVVQLLPQGASGHNVFEVYDPTHGWVMFDPSFDSSFLSEDQYASSVEVSQAERLRWRRPHDGAPDPTTFAGATISYPEPWLYTRLGERCAHLPFRACFAQIGPRQFRYGDAQHLAFGTSIASFVFALAWAAWWAVRRCGA